MNDRLKSLLAGIGEELTHALAESPDFASKLEELRAAGYSLALVLDCRRAGDEPSLQPRTPQAPVFRINSEDLAFLRSVGIDPTRKRRGRNRASAAEDR